MWPAQERAQEVGMKVRSIVVALVAAASFLVSCQREESISSSTSPAGRPAQTTATTDSAPAANGVIAIAPPTFLDMAKLGSAVGSDGAVTTEAAQFKPGQPIYFSMRFKQSPAGLAATSRWYRGTGEKEITELRKEMKGAASVTFEMKETKKWKPGHYRVEGYWGGNLAATKEFDLVK
jgi:hypothetical protein